MVDLILTKYYEFTHGEKLQFLEEHINLNLPREGSILEYFHLALTNYEKKAKIKKFGNTNLFVWLFMLFLGFSEAKVFTSWYRRFLLLIPILRYVNFLPTYRSMIFIHIQDE